MKKIVSDLRVFKTRKSIKESLIALLEVKPLSEITVTQLSEKAVINRKTFYRHYQTLEDVVKDIETDMVDTIVRHIREKDISCLDIYAVLEQIGRYIADNRRTLESVTKQTPDLFVNGRMEEMLRQTMLISLKYSAPEISEKEREYIAAFMVSGVVALYTDWFMSGCQDDLNLLIASADKLIAGGVSAYLPEKNSNVLIKALTNAPQ